MCFTESVITYILVSRYECAARDGSTRAPAVAVNIISSWRCAPAALQLERVVRPVKCRVAAAMSNPYGTCTSLVRLCVCVCVVCMPPQTKCIRFGTVLLIFSHSAPSFFVCRAAYSGFRESARLVDYTWWRWECMEQLFFTRAPLSLYPTLLLCAILGKRLVGDSQTRTAASLGDAVGICE